MSERATLLGLDLLIEPSQLTRRLVMTRNGQSAHRLGYLSEEPSG